MSSLINHVYLYICIYVCMHVCFFYMCFQMPRGKAFRRSVAAKKREAVRAEVRHLPPSPEFAPGM